MKKKVSDPLRQKLAQCVAKICAYRAVGKDKDARDWAILLQEHLRQEKLL